MKRFTEDNPQDNYSAAEVRAALKSCEDTGLTPEDLKSAFGADAIISLCAQALGFSADRLREMAAADRDGRVIILPEEKHAWTIRGDIMLGIIKANCRNFDLDFSISDAFREEEEA